MGEGNTTKNMEIIGLDKKKAQGHIELILSFVIFAGFIFFMLIFINPVRYLNTDYSSLDDVQEIITENSSMIYKSISLILSSNFEGSCFSVDDLDAGESILVKDMSENVRDAKIESNKIYIEATNNERYYKLYFSSAFNNYTGSLIGCTSLAKQNYTFGALNIQSSVLFERLIDLNNAYVGDYDGLKKGLKINKDFDFYVLDEYRVGLINDSLTAHKVFPREMFVREVPLSVVDMDAETKNVVLGIRVW